MLKLFGLLCLIFCSTNFISAKVSDVSEQLDNLEFELKGFEEEATDTVFDSLLYNTPILEKLGNMITKDLEGKVTGLLNVAKTMHTTIMADKLGIMEECRKVYTQFLETGVVDLVISGLVSQIPFFTGVVDGVKLVGATVEVSCRADSKACDIAKHTGSETAATTANAAWTFGTLFIGPLVGYIVGGVGELLEDKDLPNARACVACYLSSIMARNILDNSPQSNKRNSDEVIKYKWPRTLNAFSECKFLGPTTDQNAVNYIYTKMKAMFKVDQGVHKAADWLKNPGSTTKKLFENLLSTNDFQNAVREAGVPVIQFLAKKYWVVLKQTADAAAYFENHLPSRIGSKHKQVHYKVAVVDDWIL